MSSDNFIEQYLDFQKGTEPPTLYHRWAAITGIAAIIAKRAWVVHGHNTIYPNQYVMIVGESGARKDTAIRGIKKILTAADYKTIAADKTTKEKLLIDMEIGLDKAHDPEEDLDVTKGAKNPTMKAMFNVHATEEPSECFIMAGEFNAFLGHSNVEFIDLLTNLWDYIGIYESRIKNGRSVRVTDPIISIFGGNTGVGISMAFPTEIIGQGFFSRLIMVFAEPTGRRITRPPIPDPEVINDLQLQLRRIKMEFVGEIQILDEAWKALDDIYQSWTDLEDTRFKSYSSRRLTHLLKLAMVCAAARHLTYIDLTTIEYANSILHYTESFMPKALGEFGKARNSDVSAKILDLLNKTDVPLHPIKDIWRHVKRDLENQKQLIDILNGMRAAGQIQETAGSTILPMKKQVTFNYEHCNVGMLREYIENKLKEGV